MEAGSNLDALVAEKIMGWKNITISKYPYGTPPGKEGIMLVPEYSSNIAAAWKVVEEIQKRGFELDLWSAGNGHIWSCSFKQDGRVAEYETVPLAICLAALKAIDQTS